MSDQSEIPGGALPAVYYVYNGAGIAPVKGAVIEESTICLHVDGRELAAFMCTPVETEHLAVGFLFNEGLIRSRADLVLVERTRGGTCVDIWLRTPIDLPDRALFTSGCGRGLTFEDVAQGRRPLPPSLKVTAQQVIDRYFELRSREVLYPAARGVHASALCTPEQVLFLAEDIGRHNTLDKLAGRALLDGTATAGSLIVTTGRISTEMLSKAARMGVPVVASRTAPTSRSVALAEAWNMTVIGYIRRDSLRVYTGLDRIAPDRPAVQTGPEV